MYARKFPVSRKVIMLFGDIALIVLSYLLVTMFVLDKVILLANLSLYQGMLPVMIVVTGLLLGINGLYSITYKRFSEILLGLFVVTVSAFVIMMAISFFVREFSYSRSVLGISLLLQLIFFSVWRYFWWQIERKIHAPREIMLMGSEDECSHVYRRMTMQPQMNMKLKYICTDMEQGNWRKAIEEVDTVIICPGMRHRYKVQVINYCHENSKEVLMIPNTYEVFCVGATLDKIDDIPVFRSQRLYPSLEVRTLKRSMDIAVAGIGIICAMPFMLATAIAIKVGDHGPILYSQIRTGRYGKEFRIYKFRTMKVDAEKNTGPMLAQQNDPRITKLGKLLRAARLDELPQIWNVLIGDMSIVGPRPERPFFVEQFTKEIPEYAYRHNVKPGITGMAQVYGKYNTTAFDKLVYDLMYIEKCNLLTDLSIIIQTVKVLFSKSATEGAGIKQEPLNIEKYDIGKDIYGNF
ncbi:sugar transferase [Selenomonas ruminantium]|uniref:Exopolysaccharide biosynthesis polyprenyl glycosylphosphotransferase n=1 Tax=Selenomonas ruminantium TaxID=971 RepID=A0A1K1NNJ7_SELRU|nr:sugar transferase [Selenomonas ruminantium]SFW36857.1 exopolysaccharide biosynthesis polyprenyl glycosylphosphotransferase [Selenomonas ruminantium]